MRATVSSVAVCPSCPQAWHTPGFPETSGFLPLKLHSSSWTGRASMSARSSSVLPGRPVSSSASVPLSSTGVVSRPSAASSCRMKAAVCRSSPEGSGFWCSIS